jgi:hypothetical protein
LSWAFTTPVMLMLTRIGIGLVDWFSDLSLPCLGWWHCWGRSSIGQRYGTHRRAIRPGKSSEGSVCRFVVAGVAAGSAVHEAVGAQTHVELGLAEHTEFFTPATGFRLLTLGADDAAYTWFRGHVRSLVRPRPGRNVTEVTQRQVSGVRSQVSGKTTPCFRYKIVIFKFGFPET